MPSTIHICQVNGLTWVRMHSQATADHLGYLPEFLHVNDDLPAAQQFANNYCGGWDSFKGAKLSDDHLEMRYPGDPPLPLLWQTVLRGETVCIYDSAWTAIIQPDGSYDIARLD